MKRLSIYLLALCLALCCLTPSSALAAEQDKIVLTGLNLDGAGDHDDQASVDSVFSDSGDDYTVLEVRLGSGKTLSKRFNGRFIPHFSAGDVDGNGRDELALFLESWSSNYGGGNPHVFRVEKNALKALPAIKVNYGRIKTGYYNVGLEGCTGAAIIDGALRLKSLIGKEAAAYANLKLEKKTWYAVSSGLAQMSGYEPAAGKAPEPVKSALPKVYRAGYTPAKITFIKSPWAETDPEALGYDDVRGLPTMSARQAAAIALRCIYDMTGYNVKSCYAVIGFTTTGRIDMYFGSMRRVVNRSFASAAVDTCTGNLISVDYYFDGKDPFPAQNVVRPDGFESMTYAQIARHYYENSSYGDRRPIVGADFADYGTEYTTVKLYLETGEFYEVDFHVPSRLPYHFWGPYPKDFSH